MVEVKASMAGTVWKVSSQQESRSRSGQDIVILESMKMEIPIATEQTGLIKEVKVKEGDFVNEGDVLAVID